MFIFYLFFAAYLGSVFNSRPIGSDVYLFRIFLPWVHISLMPTYTPSLMVFSYWQFFSLIKKKLQHIILWYCIVDINLPSCQLIVHFLRKKVPKHCCPRKCSLIPPLPPKYTSVFCPLVQSLYRQIKFLVITLDARQGCEDLMDNVII